MVTLREIVKGSSRRGGGRGSMGRPAGGWREKHPPGAQKYTSIEKKRLTEKGLEGLYSKEAKELSDLKPRKRRNLLLKSATSRKRDIETD